MRSSSQEEDLFCSLFETGESVVLEVAQLWCSGHAGAAALQGAGNLAASFL